MAVAFNLSDVRRFPEGTSVKAYPVSNWPSGIVDTSAVPVGTETETQTVTGGVAAFVALTDNTEYVAYAAPGSVKTYTFFTAGQDIGDLAQQSADNVEITGGSITGITDLAVADGGTGSSTASAARTALGVGTLGTQAADSVAITGGSIAGITDLAVADGGTGSSTASDARTALGLGTIATQAANNVAVTGGSVTGITDLTVADGGTGASTAAVARVNLGVAGVVRKAANETVNNSNTFQDDDELFFAIAASEVWFVEAFLRVTSASTTADWKWGWTGPSGATASWALGGTAGGWNQVATGSSPIGEKALGSTETSGSTAGTSHIHLAGWFYNSTTPGNITLRWAQSTQTAEDNIVLANSFLRIQRLA